MVRAIFFDIDGTLVCHHLGDMPDSTQTAIAQLRALDIHCVIATGRHLSELPGLPLHGIEFDGYITLNGQLCYDKNKQLIYGEPIGGAQKEIILSLFNSCTIPIMLIEEDRMYINYLTDRVYEAQRSVNANIPVVGTYSGHTIYQAVAFVDPDEKNYLEKALSGCRLTYWTKWAVDIVPSSAGKTVGIRQYLKVHDLSPFQAMAFGDGENDRDMLTYVGTGIAMGNAPDHVKQCAVYVTEAPAENGIFNALKHFGLI